MGKIAAASDRGGGHRWPASTSARVRCSLASGLISTGWSSTKVGCCSVGSTSASKHSFRMRPTASAGQAGAGGEGVRAGFQGPTVC